jgi:hypothetical protein
LTNLYKTSVRYTCRHDPDEHVCAYVAFFFKVLIYLVRAALKGRRRRLPLPVCNLTTTIMNDTGLGNWNGEQGRDEGKSRVTEMNEIMIPKIFVFL